MSTKLKMNTGYRLMIAALVVAAVLSANVGGAKAAPAVGGIGYIAGDAGDKINARSGPSTAYDVNVQLKGGQAVEVYDGPRADKSGNVWYKVRNENGGGWVSADFLSGKGGSTKAQSSSSKPATSTQQASSTGSAAKIKTGGALKVTDGSVRMRSQASSKGSILATVDSGTVLKVLNGPVTDGAGNKWYQVSGKYTTGWISADYVAASSATPPTLASRSTTARGGTRSDDTAAKQPAPAQPAQPAPAAPASAQEQPAPQASSTGASIAAIAMKFNGYRYVYGAASPKRGFDCSGLVSYVLGVNGIGAPHSAAELYGMGTPVKSSDLQPGDIVFFAGTTHRGISHVGIYIGGGKMIHAETERTGVNIDNLWSDYYANHYAGARRIR